MALTLLQTNRISLNKFSTKNQNPTSSTETRSCRCPAATAQLFSEGDSSYRTGSLNKFSTLSSDRQQWQRIFKDLTNILHSQQNQIESLAEDRKFLEKYICTQHDFWSSKTQFLESRILQFRKEEARSRKFHAAQLGFVVEMKERGTLPYKELYDPYLITNARTMSTFEHGEVFVLDDGGEVDLDLGNYERLLDISLTRDNNITTGKICQVMQSAAAVGINITVTQVGSDQVITTVPLTTSPFDGAKEWQPAVTVDEDELIHQLRASLIQARDGLGFRILRSCALLKNLMIINQPVVKREYALTQGFNCFINACLPLA